MQASTTQYVAMMIVMLALISTCIARHIVNVTNNTLTHTAQVLK